jgi:hypothetical protein
MSKGKTTQTTNQTSRQDYQLPAYMRQGSETAVAGATERLNTPYKKFEGQRISDLSQNEQMGMAAARSNYGAFDADYDRAREYAGGVGSVADEGALEGYMNPYLDAVLDPQVRRRNEAYGAETAEMQRTSGMRGAFGGRQGVAEDQAARRHQEGLSDLYGETYSGAFDRATSLHQAEQDRKLRQSGAFTDIATSQSATNRAALRDLMATGHTERTRDQADLDFKYLEHLESRDWDINNVATLVDVLASVPHEYSQTGESSGTTTETKSSSPLKTIAGIGAIAAGAIMTGGASLALTAAGSAMLGGEE